VKLIAILITIVIFVIVRAARRRQNEPLRQENQKRLNRIAERLDFELARLTSEVVPQSMSQTVTTLTVNIRTLCSAAITAKGMARNLDKAGNHLLCLMSINEFFGATAPAGIVEPHSPCIVPDNSNRVTGIMLAGTYYEAGAPATIRFAEPFQPIVNGPGEFGICFQLEIDGILSLHMEGQPSSGPLVVIEQKVREGAKEPELEMKSFPLYQQVRFLERITFAGNNGTFLKALYVMDPVGEGLLLLVSIQHPVYA